MLSLSFIIAGLYIVGRQSGLFLMFLLFLIAFHSQASQPISGLYDQLQKQLHPPLSTDNYPLAKDDLALPFQLSTIEKSASELNETISLLQQRLSTIVPINSKAYENHYRNENCNIIESELNLLKSLQQEKYIENDRLERILIWQTNEKNTVQKEIYKINKINKEFIKEDGLKKNEVSNTRIKATSIEKKLKAHAALLPLSVKRYELELHICQLQLEKISQKMNILTPLLLMKDSSYTADSIHLIDIERELREKLTKVRQNLLVVQHLRFHLEFHIKELNQVSEVYKLLEKQRESLTKIELNFSGKHLSEQLKLERTITSEERRALGFSPATFHQRQILGKWLNRFDTLIPLAVELREMENELKEQHDQVITELEQERMWMAVTPALSASQLKAAFSGVKKQLKHLDLEAADGMSKKMFIFVLILLAIVLLLSQTLHKAQEKLLSKEKMPSLSSKSLVKLVTLIMIGCSPIPLWMATSGNALESTYGYTSALGKILQNTAFPAFLWSVIATFGRDNIQKYIFYKEGVGSWCHHANILGFMSILGLILGGFAEIYYNNPYDDFIAQVTLLTCSLSQAFTEAHLLYRLNTHQRFYFFKCILILIFPAISFFIALLSAYGYSLAAWTIFSHKQVLMLGCGGLALIYKLSLYLLANRTRYMTLEHALHQRRHNQRAIDPEDVLSESRNYMEELQEQSKRLLQLLIISIFLIFATWQVLDFSNLIEPLGKVRIWPFNSSENSLSVALGSVAKAGIILLVTILISRNITALYKLTLPKAFFSQPAKSYTISRITIYILWASSVLLILNALGISWEKLQWLIIAVSVGIGFGLQEIVANFFSGLIILIERPFRVGDAVTVGNIEGKVKQIHIRATIIEGFDRKELIVPNRTLVTGEVINWALSTNYLREVLWFGVAHGSDNKLVLNLLMKAADESPKVVKDPLPEVYFNEYKEHAEVYEMRIFVNHVDDRYPARNQVNTRAKQLFIEHDVIIAHAQHDIHMINPQY